MEVVNALGRRKTAVARVYLQDGSGKITINNRDYKDYFPTAILHYVVEQGLQITENLDKYDIKINLKGGGITGQAEAARLGIARALVKIDPEYPRMVERKKPGQPKARKKFQFSKR